jgi:hypothetical protein
MARNYHRMAKTEEKKKPQSISDIVNSFTPTIKDPKKNTYDLAKDFKRYGEWVDSDFQFDLLNKTLQPIFDKIYRPMIDRIEKTFGKPGDAANNEAKLDELAIGYVTDFLTEFNPELIKAFDIKHLEKKQQRDILVQEYDRLIGADPRRGQGLAALLEKFKNRDGATVRELKDEITKALKKNDRGEQTHADYLLDALNEQMHTRLLSHHGKLYNTHLIKQLKGYAPKGKELSKSLEADILKRAPGEVSRYHDGLVRAQSYKKPELIANYYIDKKEEPRAKKNTPV